MLGMEPPILAVGSGPRTSCFQTAVLRQLQSLLEGLLSSPGSAPNGPSSRPHWAGGLVYSYRESSLGLKQAETPGQKVANSM